MFSGNNFPSSEAENRSFESLNRIGIADLPFLKTLSGIRQKIYPFGTNKKNVIKDCSWTRTQNPLVCKQIVNHLTYFSYYAKKFRLTDL